MAERAADRTADGGESRRQKERWRREPKIEEQMAERAEDRRGVAGESRRQKGRRRISGTRWADGGESRRQMGRWRKEPKTDTQADRHADVEPPTRLFC